MSLDSDIASQLKQIEEAAKLAFEKNEYFSQILDTIVAISLAQPLDSVKLQLQCLNFIYKSYTLRKISSFKLRSENSLKLIDVLIRFIVIDDPTNQQCKYVIIQKCIEIFASSYDLMFYTLINNPNEQIWSEITKLKEFLISKWPTSYPFLILNPDTDFSRSIGCKNALVKLIGKIIQTQLPPPMAKDKKSTEDISISMVDKAHPFLYNSSLNTQGQMLMDNLLNLLNDDLLMTTSVFSTIISTLMSLFKTRPNFLSSKFLNFILGYESELKRPPKFETSKLKLRLIRRFDDRIDRILISLLLNRGFINKDPSLKTRFENKLRYLIEKSNKQKQRGILANEEDEEDEEIQRIKRRKLDIKKSEIDFYNESKFARSQDYKGIYTLINPDDSLVEFDVSTIAPEILTNMVIMGLTKLDDRKLIKALDIVSQRYTNLISKISSQQTSLEKNYNNNEAEFKVEELSNIDEDDYDPAARVSSNVINKIVKDEEEEDNENFDISLHPGNFALPLPKLLDPSQKKEQLQLIIDNFIKLSSQKSQDNSTQIDSNNDLNKVAISKWKDDSWIKILSRLATRGTTANPDISNYIRETLFDYFKDDIKNRIDGVIEWLNEEYYNETIVSESNKSKADLNEDHKVYIEYTSKVLDYLIPFLEPSDRNIFIRLLSELPYLNRNLISKIRSVCMDPIRYKIGFQPLLYLIMFRPPVFNDCIEFLKEMYIDASAKGNEQLQNECLNYLKKYKPDAIPQPIEEKANLVQPVKQEATTIN